MESWEERNKEDNGLRIKLIELEARGKHYDAEFSRINNSILGLDSKMDSGFENLSRKIDSQASSRQITWPLIFTAIGTLVALFSVGVLLVNGTLKPLTNQIESNRDLIERLDFSVDKETADTRGIASSNLNHLQEKVSLTNEVIYKEFNEQMDRNIRIWDKVAEQDAKTEALKGDYLEFKGRMEADSERYKEWIRSIESEDKE